MWFGLQGLSKGPLISFIPALDHDTAGVDALEHPIHLPGRDVLVDQGDNLYVSDSKGARARAT